ncbi:amidase [Mesorhizobium sp. M7A.F.Ca.US.010.02.1.1]|uniref:amidase n=1 Tax=Mesorhizobium sp. M7A.F.Ca.US.010.02.1.1 TaxID=2496743 RepID=UPI000FD4A775|nr:amidase [Mesorhizobium sp. M7A.F.Ca.US.010.02.1.1]RUW94194.1 amidase [Mesorhizobium sp. M7A.F.Ca.US.010.02.1.1]
MPNGLSPIADADDLCRLAAAELSAAYRAESLSPVEVTLAALDRAEAINPLFNAFTMIDRKGAIEAAGASEKRWRAGEPLSAADGIPTTLKDIVWVEGWSVRYGSRTTTSAAYDKDAPAVALLRRAGAVFIGQTTTPEFGWKAITDSGLCGITRNPWNAQKTPGGSSGGAAVAAATGAGVFHLGTDGGGSIRIPASFTGIAGLKPTFGRVPAYPSSAFGTVAHIGPMARTALDLSVMAGAMSGRDISDWQQGVGTLAPLGRIEEVLRGARIGYWSKPPSGALDPGIAAVVSHALACFDAFGATVEPIDLPGGDLLDLFQHHWFTGAAARLALVPPSERAGIDPGFLEIAQAGAAFDVHTLVAAQLERAEFGAAMDRLLDDYDFIVSPGTSIPAFDVGLEVPLGSGLSRWIEWAAFSYPINLSQQPACVIPCGMTEAGLPVGFQIIGARGDDARVLSAAADLEAAFVPMTHAFRQKDLV